MATAEEQAECARRELLRVQDQGSQLAALALVRAMLVGEGECWSSTCALAPVGRPRFSRGGGAR